jgi:hypothetical protein
MKTVLVRREEVERIQSGIEGRHIYIVKYKYRALARHMMLPIGYALD